MDVYTPTYMLLTMCRTKRKKWDFENIVESCTFNFKNMPNNYATLKYSSYNTVKQHTSLCCSLATTANTSTITVLIKAIDY